MSRVAEHSQDFNLFEVLFCFVFFWRGKKEYVFFFPLPKKKEVLCYLQKNGQILLPCSHKKSTVK